MAEGKNNPEQLLQAWKNCVAGKFDATAVPVRIAESWMRSYKMGLNPYNNVAHSCLTEQELERTLAEKKELVDVVKPIMANLYQFVKGSGFVVVLTDERGYIIDLLGDEDAFDNPLTSDFFLGAGWQEEEAGTNAIGTALIQKEPIQVSGAEHYYQKHHCLTCSAAPIVDREGRIVAVLDMSGASYLSHLHTLGMVVAAAQSINAMLTIRHAHRELAIANDRLTNLFDTMTEGVIMINRCGEINQMNPAAQKIFHLAERETADAPLEALLGVRAAVVKRMLKDREAFEDIELMVDVKNSTVHCLVSGRPLADERGQVIGGVIILNPIAHVQKLVNRFGGYYATLQFSDIVAESEEMRDAVRVAMLAASTSSNILIHGESGTGKEIFAQAIHNKSKQSQGPFLALNCGVIPRELIGSELFGYAEGAFTGAKRGGKPGKFELASGGTLFLDEIGDMPLEQQIALLRVLQEKKVTRLGSDKVVPVDARIICATNKNLLQAVEKGSFRQDLYYRLNVISISLPPLRTRVKDIALLFRHFLDQMGRERGREYQVEDAVIERLEHYRWPGNVRELQNFVERVASLDESQMITVAQLPEEIQAPAGALLPVENTEETSGRTRDLPVGEGEQWRQKLIDLERRKILSALTKHNGNISVAAKELGLSRSTLYRRIRNFGLDN